MKKKLLITSLSVMLAMGITSCASTSTSAGADPYSDELNTNPDDIRALDFYSVDASEEDYTINPLDNLTAVTEFTQLDAPVTGDVVAVFETNMGVIKVKLMPEVAPRAVHNFVEHSLNDYYDGLKFHRVIDEFMVQSGDPLGTGYGGESIWGTPFVNEISTYARHFPGALAMANSGTNVSNGSQFYIVDYFDIPEALISELDYYGENQDVTIDSLYATEEPEAELDSETVVEAIEGETGEELVEEEVVDNSPLVKDMFPVEIIEAYKEQGGAPYLDFGYTVFGQTYEGMDVVDSISQVATDENALPAEDVIIEDVVIGIYK